MSSEKIESLKIKGKRLRDARKAAGLKLRQLAEKAGCTPGNLSAIERGKWGWSHSLLMNLCRSLNPQQKQLTTGEGAIYKDARAGAGHQVHDEPAPYLNGKRLRLVREVKELMKTADDETIDALLKNVRQFKRIPPAKKEE